MLNLCSRVCKVPIVARCFAAEVITAIDGKEVSAVAENLLVTLCLQSMSLISVSSAITMSSFRCTIRASSSSQQLTSCGKCKP